METTKKIESRLLDRTEVEVRIRGRAGKISRAEAVGMVAEEMNVEKARVGLVRLEQNAGTSDVVGRFMVYGSAETMKSLHPKYLAVRLMTKEEREALKQAKKRAKTPAPEAKK